MIFAMGGLGGRVVCSLQGWWRVMILAWVAASRDPCRMACHDAGLCRDPCRGGSPV